MSSYFNIRDTPSDDKISTFKTPTGWESYEDIAGQTGATGATGSSNSDLPVGTIVMYNGASEDIPPNWKICDGSSYIDSTGNSQTMPDLQDRFVIGTGNIFSLGQTGGTTTITADNLPQHTHSGTTDNDSGEHFHYIPMEIGTQNIPVVETINTNYGLVTLLETADYPVAITLEDSPGNGAHEHNFTTDGGTGNGTTYYPPYYALIYIMKVSAS